MKLPSTFHVIARDDRLGTGPWVFAVEPGPAAEERCTCRYGFAYEVSTDKFCPGPKVELFARRQWSDWACLGDQMPEVAAQ